MGQGMASNAEAAGAASPHVWFLPAEPVSASVLRRDLQELLVLLPAALVDDVVLATSELVANAVLHGAGPISVSVWPGGHALRVEVTDSGGGTPQLRQITADQDEGGRGLFIVDSVADRWGVLPLGPGRGTTVWFEVNAVSESAAPASS